MKKIVFTISAVATSALLLSWGTFGHEHINKAAVYALPAPLQTFFYNHIDYITQESTVPDLRKYTIRDKAEAPRHFIDLENFGSPDSLPQTMEEAKKKYDEKFLQQNGILPWYMEEMMDKLTKAFKEKRKTEILFIASDLGHYVGDAHMPLHTSANYDGQETNQKGIHALWESRVPELYGNGFNFHSGEAKHIEDIRKECWRMVNESHSLVNELFSKDSELRKKMGDKNVYKTDAEGKQVKNKFGVAIYTDEYTKEFYKTFSTMIENQMKRAIAVTSNFWYTAWVNAGKPDLKDLDPEELTKRNALLLEEDMKLWKEGKLFGVESEKEF